MRDILAEIDAALERIRQRGGKDSIYYAQLQAKRDAVARGASYRIMDVTEALIGGVGAMFATINSGSNGQRLPARGSLPALWKRLSEAAEQSAVFYPALLCAGSAPTFVPQVEYRQLELFPDENPLVVSTSDSSKQTPRSYYVDTVSES